MNNLDNLKKESNSLANPQRANNLAWFFKTGKGEYGEGDDFLGLNAAQARGIAKKYKDLFLDDVGELLKSEFHEERAIALLILVDRFTSEEKLQKEIFEFYLNNTKYINNWDLVDISAPKIVGKYLMNRSRSVLYKLAKSDNLWKRRIAILSTFYFIGQGEYDGTFKIAEILLKDKHDLIQKAVGWMLREVGKRCSEQKEKEFLNKHLKVMPRTTLRYAIERFPQNERKKFLKH